MFFFISHVGVWTGGWLPADPVTGEVCTVYRIEVAHAWDPILTWIVFKRYKAFKDLHTALTGDISPHIARAWLPPLPPTSLIGLFPKSESALAKRMMALHKWMFDLLLAAPIFCASSTNELILKFLDAQKMFDEISNRALLELFQR